MRNLPISAETVSYVVAMARDIEDMLPSTEANDEETHRGEANDPELITEHEYDTLYQELNGFLKTLSDEELAALTAILWVGRGTYDADDFEGALTEASSLDAARAPAYLLSSELLAEYLSEGMSALGADLEEL